MPEPPPLAPFNMKEQLHCGLGKMISDAGIQGHMYFKGIVYTGDDMEEER